MAFVVLGLLLSGLKLAGFMIVGGWSWWVVLAPFAMAAAWWAFADASGITQREVMRREDERAQQRREDQLEKLGLRSGPRQRKGGDTSKWR